MKSRLLPCLILSGLFLAGATFPSGWQDPVSGSTTLTAPSLSKGSSLDTPHNTPSTGYPLDFLKLLTGQEQKAEDQEKKSTGIGITLTLHVEEDVSDKFFNQFSERIKKLSAYIWRCTEGNFYIDSATLSDQAPLTSDEEWKQKGALVIKKGWLNRTTLPGKGATDAQAGYTEQGEEWFVWCTGAPGMATLCHEVFHGYFHMLHCGESFCIMKASSGANDVLGLCDDSNHKTPKGEGKFAQKESCWSLITKKFPDAKRPPKGTKPGNVPETKITINNK